MASFGKARVSFRRAACCKGATVQAALEGRPRFGRGEAESRRSDRGGIGRFAADRRLGRGLVHAPAVGGLGEIAIADGIGGLDLEAVASFGKARVSFRRAACCKGATVQAALEGRPRFGRGEAESRRSDRGGIGRFAADRRLGRGLVHAPVVGGCGEIAVADCIGGQNLEAVASCRKVRVRFGRAAGGKGATVQAALEGRPDFGRGETETRRSAAGGIGRRPRESGIRRQGVDGPGKGSRRGDRLPGLLLRLYGEAMAAVCQVVVGVRSAAGGVVTVVQLAGENRGRMVGREGKGSRFRIAQHGGFSGQHRRQGGKGGETPGGRSGHRDAFGAAADDRGQISLTVGKRGGRSEPCAQCRFPGDGTGDRLGKNRNVDLAGGIQAPGDHRTVALHGQVVIIFGCDGNDARQPRREVSLAVIIAPP